MELGKKILCPTIEVFYFTKRKGADVKAERIIPLTRESRQTRYSSTASRELACLTLKP